MRLRDDTEFATEAQSDDDDHGKSDSKLPDEVKTTR